MDQFSHSHKVESLSKMVTMQADKLQRQAEAFKAIKRMLRQGRLVAAMDVIKRYLKEG